MSAQPIRWRKLSRLSADCRLTCAAISDRARLLPVAPVVRVPAGRVSSPGVQFPGVTYPSSVFVVVIIALVASTGHFVKFVQTGGDTLNMVLSIVIFTVPGVISGGQIGALVFARISQHTLERGLAALFFIVVAHESALLFPDYPGNCMFNTLGNVQVNPRVGGSIPPLGTMLFKYLR